MQHIRNLTSATELVELIRFLRAENYSFVTPTPATHARINARPGNEHARSLTGAFGWSRPFARTLLPAQLFDLLRESGAIFESAEGWRSSVRASTLDGDLFLHSAFPTVAADAIFFGPDTHRFARAIKHELSRQPRALRRALDIGCGSGAGGVVVARRAPCAELVLSDINAAALQMAQTNADAAGVHNVTTIFSDLFAGIEGEFDLIVANPPYLNDPLQRTYRHGGGEHGSLLSIRIAQAAKERLSPRGTLLLYTGSPIVDGTDRLRQALERDLQGSALAWTYEEVDPDVFGEELDTQTYSDVERIAAVVLIVRKPGGGAC
jgi:methylase of polypeptide subunit release factors